MNPARPGPGVALCRLDEIADPGARGFDFRAGDQTFMGFVVRLGERAVGYIDSCPHAGWPLAIGDRYLTRDARYILCAGHGAAFTPDTGACVFGPCAGEHLPPWPVEVGMDGVVRTA